MARPAAGRLRSVPARMLATAAATRFPPCMIRGYSDNPNREYHIIGSPLHHGPPRHAPRFDPLPRRHCHVHRNGVGVTKNGEVVFAMTDAKSPKFPNFHEFAQLFRSLGCEDALFLDGNVCEMRSGADVNNRSDDFGSIIAVTKSMD